MHETWTMVLDHVTKNMEHPQTLKDWVASLIQQPNKPLPYLYLYGPQCNGKTLFCEALGLLVPTALVDYALFNTCGYNEVLQHVSLCVTENINFNENIAANLRLRSWLTPTQLHIWEKGKPPVYIDNTLHWIQCANTDDAYPLLEDIIMINLPELTKITPKKELLMALKEESQSFLGSIL